VCSLELVSADTLVKLWGFLGQVCVCTKLRSRLFIVPRVVMGHCEFVESWLYNVFAYKYIFVGICVTFMCEGIVALAIDLIHDDLIAKNKSLSQQFHRVDTCSSISSLDKDKRTRGSVLCAWKYHFLFNWF